MNVSWRTVKNNGRMIILQRRDLPHHVISAYIGDENSWWGSAFYNFSYSVKFGSTEKYIVKDLIINDLDSFYGVVTSISNYIKQNCIDNMVERIREKINVIAYGQEEYVEKYPKNDVVRPYQILIHNEKEREKRETAESIAKAIRKLLKK